MKGLKTPCEPPPSSDRLRPGTTGKTTDGARHRRAIDTLNSRGGPALAITFRRLPTVPPLHRGQDPSKMRN
jgi:hypothetical protein